MNSVKNVHTRHATDTTEKFLFQLQDHSLIETVLIPATPGLTTQSDRHTVCISTQVGCAYACKFCASGLEGLIRNLTPGEIVGNYFLNLVNFNATISRTFFSQVQ